MATKVVYTQVHKSKDALIVFEIGGDQMELSGPQIEGAKASIGG